MMLLVLPRTRLEIPLFLLTYLYKLLRKCLFKGLFMVFQWTEIPDCHQIFLTYVRDGYFYNKSIQCIFLHKLYDCIACFGIPLILGKYYYIVKNYCLKFGIKCTFMLYTYYFIYSPVKFIYNPNNKVMSL